jgi:hypothetical protein
VLVGLGGVLVGFFVITGFVVLGCGVVGLGGVLVMLGGFAVGFVCHGVLLCPDIPVWEMLGPGMFHRHEGQMKVPRGLLRVGRVASRGACANTS